MEQSIGDAKTCVGTGATEAELAPGMRLGQYEIVRLLGRGGMGQVYLARHALQRTLHALKILPSAFSGEPGFVERFRTELRTMAAMQHPNIVHVTYSDVDNGRYYLVMDFVSADGILEPYDLEHALSDAGRFSPETVWRLAVQLCDGLACAHRLGVVHRDLKPANVLLTSRWLEEADVRICDFGLAKVAGEEFARSMVVEEVRLSMSLSEKDTFVEGNREQRGKAEAIVGTYGYMSPEQEDGRPVDARSDIYSVGVMLYRMVTGLRLRGIPKPASQVVHGLDSRWDAVIGRCLENDPDARWQTAEELKAAFESFADTHSGRETDSVDKEGFRNALDALVASALTVWDLARERKDWVKARWWMGAAILVLAVWASSRTGQAQRGGSQAKAVSVAVAQEKAAMDKPPVVAPVVAEQPSALQTRIVSHKRQGASVSLASETPKQLYRSRTDDYMVKRQCAAAATARERVLKVDRGQGMGTRVDAMNEVWREAETARQSGGNEQAMKGYEAVIAACGLLGEDEAFRQIAKMRRGDAEVAKGDAEREKATAYAAVLMMSGGEKVARAAGLFEKGEFADAAKEWRTAVDDYVSAKTRAISMQAYCNAKEDLVSMLTGDEVASRTATFKARSGQKWAEVLRLQHVGDAYTNDLVAGTDAYRQAVVVLKGALEDVCSEERLSQVTAMLEAARKDREGQKWLNSLNKAREVLRLDPSNAVALEIKAEAVLQLAPKLALVAEVDGKAFPAEVSDGCRTWKTPATIPLSANMNYRFTVTADTAPPTQAMSRIVHYKPITLAVVADWTGTQTFRAALKEDTGPIVGEVWRSPLSSAEFVWIPVLKLWVGKCEVTNGEYRRKGAVPGGKDGQEGVNQNDEHYPVVGVNFDDAKAYAEWLTVQDKNLLGELCYRVISEAEWLVCAQCGTNREFPWGSSMPPVRGNYADHSSAQAVKLADYADGHENVCPVEESGENEWGLFGIGGNVWDCCAADVSGVTFGAWRGASWCNGATETLRCAYRNNFDKSSRVDYCGFRLVLAQKVTVAELRQPIRFVSQESETSSVRRDDQSGYTSRVVPKKVPTSTKNKRGSGSTGFSSKRTLQF